MDIYTLPNVEWMAGGKHLHSTGRLARCFVTTYRDVIGSVGGRHKRAGTWGMCIRIADSLCYTAEANAPL